MICLSKNCNKLFQKITFSRTSLPTFLRFTIFSLIHSGRVIQSSVAFIMLHNYALCMLLSFSWDVLLRNFNIADYFKYLSVSGLPQYKKILFQQAVCAVNCLLLNKVMTFAFLLDFFKSWLYELLKLKLLRNSSYLKFSDLTHVFISNSISFWAKTLKSHANCYIPRAHFV